MDRERKYFEAAILDAEMHGVEDCVSPQCGLLLGRTDLVDANVCQKCGQRLDYKYYKQVSRCLNCDFFRVPCSNGDAIP